MGARYRPHLLLLCMCVAFLAAPREVLSQSASDLGEAQGNSVLNIYGTKSGITNNVSNPLTSSNTPMTTVDGSTSFSGQLQCPNSQRFMEVLIQPGATGDIDHLHREPGHDVLRQPRLHVSRCPSPYQDSARTGSSRAIRGRGRTARPTSGPPTRPEGSPFSRSPSRPSAAASASTTRAEPISSSAIPPPS